MKIHLLFCGGWSVTQRKHQGGEVGSGEADLQCLCNRRRHGRGQLESLRYYNNHNGREAEVTEQICVITHVLILVCFCYLGPDASILNFLQSAFQVCDDGT
jgi:hypothetical protein